MTDNDITYKDLDGKDIKLVLRGEVDQSKPSFLNEIVPFGQNYINQIREQKQTFFEKELERIKNDWQETHPERVKLFTEQYLQWGFSDEDTWDLSIHLAKIILPRLKRFKELASSAIKIDFPLDDMIEGFQLLEDLNYDTWQLRDEKLEKVQKGLKAFSEHFFELWW